VQFLRLFIGQTCERQIAFFSHIVSPDRLLKPQTLRLGPLGRKSPQGTGSPCGQPDR
jgi:anaerobic selenocysteine-containing dehydrogenase